LVLNKEMVSLYLLIRVMDLPDLMSQVRELVEPTEVLDLVMVLMYLRQVLGLVLSRVGFLHLVLGLVLSQVGFLYLVLGLVLLLVGFLDLVQDLDSVITNVHHIVKTSQNCYI